MCLTTLAILLGTESSAVSAFQIGGHGHFLSLKRTFVSSSTTSTAVNDNSLDDVDCDLVDTSKLPRLYVGNPELTRRMPVTQGLVAALEQTTSTASASHRLRPEIPVTLSAAQSHYLTKVLRLGIKAKAAAAVPHVRLFDGCGEEWLAKILVSYEESRSSRAREALTALCIKPLRQQTQQSSAQAPSKNNKSCFLIVAPTKKKDRIRWMIEKCTELNVAGFLLLETEHSETHSVSLAKMQAYAIEAAEQCERLTVPSFVVLSGEGSNDSDNVATSLDSLLEAWKVDKEKVSLGICRERSNQAVSVLEYISSAGATGVYPNLAFVVGPEGGWSPRETSLFDTLAIEYPGAIPAVSLGSTILRSETACMLAVGAFVLAGSEERFK